MRKRLAGWITPLAIVALALTACDSGPTDVAEDDLSIDLKVVSGSEQTAVAGTELPDPLVVKVEKLSGWGRRKRWVPKPHQLVNFVVVEGGGSVFAGAALTNWKGIAQEFWTLGPEPGLNVLEVRAVNPYTGEKQVFATFTAIGLCEPIATVTVTPTDPGDDLQLQAGETVQLSALLENGDGDELTGCVVEWESSDETVATVSDDGLVTAHAVGDATITATSQGTQGSAVVSVLPVPVDEVTLDLNIISIPEGSSVDVTATVWAGGVQVFDREVSWTTDDASIATVSPTTGPTATVTGVNDGGPIMIRATSEGVYAEASVTVTPSGPGLDDVEPNDDKASASDLGSVSEGETKYFHGNFAEEPDQYDYYAFSAVEIPHPDCSNATPDQWQLTVVLKDIPLLHDYDLALYTPGSFLPLGVSDNGGSIPETISIAVGPVAFPGCGADDSTDFIVEVREWSGTATSDPYTLEIKYERTSP